MSLVRTAVRLCAVEALKGKTVAEERVYDSRIGDIQPETFEGDAKPTVIVLTDGDDGEALSEQNGGPPFDRMVDLVFEIGMVQSHKNDGDAGGFMVGYPDTDARLEASLDVLEFQMLRRLAYDLAPICATFRSFVRPMKYNSHRQVLDDTGFKIAARIVTLTCRVVDDRVEILLPGTDAPEGIGALPDPLRRVAAGVAAGAGLDTINGIVSALWPLTADKLEGVDLNSVPTDLTAQSAGPPDAATIVDVSAEITSATELPETVATGAVIIDYARGTTQKLILAADVPQVTVINWPGFNRTGRLILIITNTGNFAIAGWPLGTYWVDDVEPAITQGAGKRDIIVLTSINGGGEIYGSVVGQNYANA